MIDRLLQKDLDEGSQEYLNAFTDLVETYEDEHVLITDASQADVLRELMRSNGYEGNTEDYGAHTCCEEKPCSAVTALWGLELRLRGFLLVERVREATSYEIVT
jgi:hypothetical protein